MAVTLLALWYANLPALVTASDTAQVEKEAAAGGYRLIDVKALSKLYQSNRDQMLLVDTRQEWEHRAGHITGSINFPMAPTWWERWRKKRDLGAFLGPDKEKTIVFY